MDPYVVALDEQVAGAGLQDYANRWWQWAYSMPQRDSPVRDQDGRHCQIGQEAPVWFLAGGFGSSKITRACTVPSGQHLFFPVINMMAYNNPGGNNTCAGVKRAVARNNDRFVYIRVYLNGSRIVDAERFRVASDACFDPLARVPANVFPPSFAPAATDGYWIMLRPLPEGTHDLAFRAFYTSNDGSEFGEMVQNINYTLTVLPES